VEDYDEEVREVMTPSIFFRELKIHTSAVKGQDTVHATLMLCRMNPREFTDNAIKILATIAESAHVYLEWPVGPVATYAEFMELDAAKRAWELVYISRVVIIAANCRIDDVLPPYLSAKFIVVSHEMLNDADDDGDEEQDRNIDNGV
jgi:hypothetical protein